MRLPTKTIVIVPVGDQTEIQLTGMFNHKERARWWERIHDALDEVGLGFAEPLGHPDVAVPCGQRVAGLMSQVCEPLQRAQLLGVEWRGRGWQDVLVGVVQPAEVTP